MPEAIRLSDDAVNAEADATCALLDGGYLRIYAGDRPSEPRAMTATMTLLAELRFASPAFKLADGGKAAANPITADYAARGRGKPTWFRAFREDGVTPVMDGSVGVGNANLLLGAEEIVPGVEVFVDSFVYVRPAR